MPRLEQAESKPLIMHTMRPLTRGLNAFSRITTKLKYGTPGMIDYPISGNEIKTEGVEYILTYLERLLYENRYCNGFSKEEIHTVLFWIFTVTTRIF